jgi:hypothetical protein
VHQWPAFQLRFYWLLTEANRFDNSTISNTDVYVHERREGSGRLQKNGEGVGTISPHDRSN